MRRLTALFLLLAMLVTLCACGKDENLGLYKCVEVSGGAADGQWLELTSSKEGKLKLDFELTISWTLSGTEFTAKSKALDETYTGTMEDGVIRLNVEGADMVFVKDGAHYEPAPTKNTEPVETTEPPTTAPTEPDVTTQPETEPVTEPAPETEPTTPPTEKPADNQTELQKWWNGDYYGYWALFASDEDTTEEWWDCCAKVEINADGAGKLVIWDENFNDPEDGLAEVEIQVIQSDGTGPNGVAMSLDGWFAANDVNNGDWLVETEAEEFPDGISIRGDYVEDGEEFTFSIYLRKWGKKWDDVADTYVGLPYYYENWYLPAIQAGAKMPRTLLGDFGDGLEAQPLGLRSDFIPVESDAEVSMPLSMLKSFYAKLQKDLFEVYFMDYSDVITGYVGSTPGRIGYVEDDGTYFAMFWTANDSDDFSYMEIDFKLNEDGIWMFDGMSASDSVMN